MRRGEQVRDLLLIFRRSLSSGTFHAVLIGDCPLRNERGRTREQNANNKIIAHDDSWPSPVDEEARCCCATLRAPDVGNPRLECICLRLSPLTRWERDMHSLHGENAISEPFFLGRSLAEICTCGDLPCVRRTRELGSG